MERSKYIILRKKVQKSKPPVRLGMFTTRSPGRGSIPGLGGPFAGSALGGLAGEEEVRAELQTETLSEAERFDMQRDEEVLGISAVMPVSLTRPVAATVGEVEQACHAGVAWGVATVAPNLPEQAGAGFKVAVLDTGIDPGHPAFRGVKLERRNFSDSWLEDDIHGHGTHCAATIFGRDVDGVRIGIARGVRDVLIAKVLNEQGQGDSAAIGRAILWAQENGAHVISLSVAIDFAGAVATHIEQGINPKAAAAKAISAYRDTVRLFDSLMQLVGRQQSFNGSRGVVVVAAAGNDSDRTAARPLRLDVDLPAAADGVIAVGAIGRGPQGYQVAPFSNANPHLCAPGVDIVSARAGGGLCVMSGTSTAAPHVAGVALLWWEQLVQADRRTRAEQIKTQLMAGRAKGGFAAGLGADDIGQGLALAPQQS